MTATLIVALTAGLLTADAPRDEAAKAEMKKLEGTWAFQSVTAEGQEVPPANFMALRITQSTPLVEVRMLPFWPTSTNVPLP